MIGDDTSTALSVVVLTIVRIAQICEVSEEVEGSVFVGRAVPSCSRLQINIVSMMNRRTISCASHHSLVGGINEQVCSFVEGQRAKLDSTVRVWEIILFVFVVA